MPYLIRCRLALCQVIREARPCHLYFDLEFVPAVNPSACGDALVDALLRLVAAELWCVRHTVSPDTSMKSPDLENLTYAPAWIWTLISHAM